MRIPLAGGVDETIMSEVSAVILPFFTMAEATVLRLVCREFLEAVRDFQWEDRKTVIQGSIGAWRGSYPRARCANVSKFLRRAPVVDADFVHFVGLRELNMEYCRGVTNAAFVHLVGIQRLSISFCDQARLTDAAFLHLRGIQLLDMSCCEQFSDAAFVHLRGIRTLYMWDCHQPAISDAAFVHLRGIHTLVMDGCDQATITGSSFAHLQGIQALGMYECRADQVATARSLGLRVNMRDCTSMEGLHYTFDERGWDENDVEEPEEEEAEDGDEDEEALDDEEQWEEDWVEEGA